MTIPRIKNMTPEKRLDKVRRIFLPKIPYDIVFRNIKKTISYGIFGKKIRLTLSNLFSGDMFLILGIVIAYLAFTNNLITNTSYQININIYLTRFIQLISNYTKIIPEPAWAIIFFIIFLFII